MKKMKSLLTLGLLLGLAACGQTKTETVEAEEEKITDIPAPVVWVAQDDDSELYLIGTVPYLQKSAEWETLAIRGATDDASQFFFEYDPSDNAVMASMMLTQELGFYTDGSRLSDRLDADANALLQTVSETSQIPFGRLQNLKPWLAAMLLGSSAAEQAELNVDNDMVKSMVNRAEINNKTVTFLETPESRVRDMAELPEDLQIRFLTRTATRYPGLGDKMVETADAWQVGSLMALKNDGVNLQSQLPSREYKAFIESRNKEWIDTLDNFMQGEGVGVVVVGMPHLLMEEVNLQLMLIDRKYNVKRYYGVE